MSSNWSYVGFGLIPILFIGFVFFYSSWRARNGEQLAADLEGIDGQWIPTGRIDFYPESNNRYVLQAEDSRDVTSIGGLQRKEIRWRVASLDEAKKVVVKFHQEASN